MRTVYVGGAFVPENEATISIFDRSFLFSHGVYEVCAVLESQLIDFDPHMKRLKRSLSAINIPQRYSDDELFALMKELIARNDLKEGLVYLQISRGVQDRDFLAHDTVDAPLEPMLVMFTQVKELTSPDQIRRGIAVKTIPDIRWARRDIKAVGLLGPVLAKEEARLGGFEDAWMYQDGFITEGTSNNAYIVDEKGTLITRHLGHEILHGVTRQAILALAETDGVNVEERAFTIEEAHKAKEAFITSASSLVWPVVKIDNRVIGDGTPGPVALKLRSHYIKAALATAK